MKIFIFILLSLFPLSAFAQSSVSTMVEPSGVYTGPLQTQASPVVVELFSSENCPACPEADEYMNGLVKSKGVIALSCHVDYFGKTSANLGKAFCTEKQTKYIKRMGRKSHFTPQMMINGHISEIGYETDNVAAAIVKGRSERVARIAIQPKVSGVFDFHLPTVRLGGTANLWMAVYQKPKTVTHRGNSSTYANVVKNIVPLGTWQGGEMSRVFQPIADSNSAGFAVIAQDPTTGKILAAGDYKL